jgi:hypothetical protein
MSSKRMFVFFACVAIAFGANGFVGTAFAVGPQPANDLISGATVVSSLPFTQTLDTTGATTDATDTQANAICGAPFTNNSVWYQFTAGAGDTHLGVDTTGSNFTSGVLIATGTPGALNTVACGPTRSGTSTTAGKTYYIMVFDDSGSGGTLHLSIHGPGPVPANDKAAHAIAITHLPYKVNLDTTGATSDYIDTQANKSCGAPAVGNSVWYTYTPGLKHTLIFNAENSDYSAGILVATADQGALTTVACGPYGITAKLSPHTTYYVMVFDAGGSGGGTLGLTISEAPTASLHVQKYARVDKTGAVHYRGTYSCRRISNLRIFADVLQIVGDNVVESHSPEVLIPSLHCTGGPRPLNGIVPAGKVKFVPGKAVFLLEGDSCNNVSCVFPADEAVVQLGTHPAGGATAPEIHHTTRRTLRAPQYRYRTATRASHVKWGRRQR